MNFFLRSVVDAQERKYLLEMASSRKKTISLISGYWWDIVSHFFKCIIFPNDPSYNHWISEIAAWLNYINNQFAKTKSFKLKKEVYMDEVFGINNTFELRDIRSWLENFQLRDGKKYPEFEISKGLVAKCFEYYYKLADYFSSLFEVDRSDKNKTSQFRNIIPKIITATREGEVPDWRILL